MYLTKIAEVGCYQLILSNFTPDEITERAKNHLDSRELWLVKTTIAEQGSGQPRICSELIETQFLNNYNTVEQQQIIAIAIDNLTQIESIDGIVQPTIERDFAALKQERSFPLAKWAHIDQRNVRQSRSMRWQY